MLKANFTRASIAYLKDGTQVASGVPRFEWGRFGEPSIVETGYSHYNKAIMVEEGTTNLFTAPTDFTNAAWVKNSLTVAQVASGFKLTPTSVSGFINQAYTVDPNGKSFTYSVEMRGDVVHNAQIKLENTANTQNVVKTCAITTEWQRFTVSGTFTEVSTTLKALIWPGNYAGTTDYVYARNPQLEEKPYATSFTDGTRAIERLNVPAPNMSPAAGTIEVVVDVNAAAKRNAGTYFPVVFAIGQDGVTAPDYGGWIVLAHNPSNSTWYLSAKRKSTAATNLVSIADSVVPNGYVTFTVKWDQTNGARIYVEGEPVSAYLAPAYLPDNFYSQFEIGHISNDVNRNLNTTFDSVRLSNIARTDAEILASYQSSRAREL